MGNKVQIIAEIGVNHNGKIDLAYEMIDKASNAGVDVVKFQTSIPNLVTSIYAPKAEYQLSSTDSGESMLEMCDKSNLSFEDTKTLKVYAEKKDIKFLSSPFDLESIDFLMREVSPDTRKEIVQIADIFRAHIVGVSPDSVIIEVAGDADKMTSIQDLLKGYGLLEVMRTGTIVMHRGKSS